MKARSKKAMLFVLVVVVGGLLWWGLFPLHEPEYRGKPLSVWVASRTPLHDFTGNPELDAVVGELDEQGIRLLGRYMNRRRLSERQFYARGYSFMPGKIQSLFPKPDLKQQFRINAAWMLAQLKQKAKPAQTDLIAAVTDLDFDYRVRELAARTLFSFGSDAAPAIPALTQALNDPNELVVECAARALGAIGPAAGPSLPVLQSAIGRRRDYLTVALAEAVWKIDPTQSSRVMPILRDCLQHANGYSKVYGSQVLWDLARDHETTVPVLTALIADTNQASFHVWSIMLLGQMGSNATAAVPLLESRASADGAPEIRRFAREALEKIDPHPPAKAGGK